MKLNYKHTLYACCIGYVTQAIVNNLMPLLFVTLNRNYKVGLDKIGLLITINFVIQMSVDFSAAKYVHKFGYKSLVIFANAMSFIGLFVFGISPFVMPGNIYPMLVLSVVTYAVGGGLLEVLISPMVEALPIENKEGTMSFLHSFYCWGQVGVTLLSTVYFVTVGIDKWMYLPFLWSVFPLFNVFLFFFVPIYILDGDGEKTGIISVLKNKLFWLFAVLMIGAGASELAMSQWSSYFAEVGLGVSKTVGDLLGPLMFAVLMGVSRTIYGKLSSKIKLLNALMFCSVMCVFCYIIATVSPYPFVSIIGCALCGFSVGIMWPGVYSLSAKYCKSGGTVMFALLALCGDVGCTAGPSIVGYISDAMGGSEFAIKTALFSMIVFPVIMIGTIAVLKKYIKKKEL